MNSITASTQLTNIANLESMAADWIRFAAVNDRSRRSYETGIKSFMAYCNANQINNPTAGDVEEYKSVLMATKQPATVSLYLSSIRLFFAWLDNRGMYPNIAARIKGARTDRDYKKDYLTTSQSKALLAATGTGNTGRRDAAMISLMITTGLRTIEVATANIGDLRTLDDCTVLYIQGKGHTSKSDFVKIPAAVEEKIRQYLTAERPAAKATDPLFIGESNHAGTDGGRMTTRSISRIVKGRMAKANLVSSRLTAHSLRHTAATISLRNGVAIQEVQQMMRHANINTTLIYAHSIEKTKNHASEAVASALFG